MPHRCLRVAGIAMAAAPTVLAGSALAQEPPFTTLFEAFEAVTADAPPEELSYGSADPLGDEGIELTDVVVTSPDGDQITVDSLRVDALEVASINEDRPPNYVTATVEGLTVPASALDEADLASLGIESLTANIQIDYLLDAASSTFEVSTAVVEVVDLGTLTVELSLANVMPDVFANPMMLMGAAIGGATVTYDDNGLIGLALAEAAADEGRSEQELIDEALAEIDAARQGAAAEGGGPATDAAFAAFAAFIADAPEPAGVLSILVAPASPVPLAAIANPETMSQGADMLSATVTYE